MGLFACWCIGVVEHGTTVEALGYRAIDGMVHRGIGTLWYSNSGRMVHADS